MCRVSKKRAARNAEAKPVRDRLKADVQKCEICGCDPRRSWAWWLDLVLDVHEIARGEHREKALDKRYALLIVCRRCHVLRLSSPAEWPEARQLAALKRSRPADYDLAAFLKLKNPNAPKAVTQDEVDKWME